MQDYTPVDLAPVRNVGTQFVSPDAEPPLGSQWFHGLPFQIGDDPNRCFIGFDVHTQDTITIPVASSARTIIFAHALLDTRIPEGDPVGQPVAHYAVHFDNGETIDLPVRERFEVSIIPTPWGQWPFLAVPDQPDGLVPRESGHWDQIGWRQAEATYAHANDYYLWAWQNPHPDRTIEHLTITSVGRKFLVAAITLGHVDETPFFRQGRVPVKITLPQPEDADQAFDLVVTIDRGVAT
ncbi:MAG: hypothetical protein GY767_09735, partial [Shimia sp.]|nr:hypothetical protein [Shimia sp.]